MAIDSIKQQLEINAAVAARSKALEAETAELSKQLGIARQLQAAFEDVKAPDIPGDELDDLNEALTEAADNAAEFGSTATSKFDAVADSIDGNVRHVRSWREGLAGIVKDFPLMGAAAAGALDGIVSGFQLSLNMARSLIGFLGSVGKGFFNVGKSILAIPFRIMNGLVEMAKAGGGGTELMQAFENVRKEFGSFKEATSRDVIKSARDMRGELSNTGLSVYRVFGQLHERLEFFMELAKSMGAVFSVMSTNIAKNVEPIAAFQKGLGIANEEMKSFGEAAIREGKPIQDVLLETANLSLQLGSQFGLSQKLIAKDMAKMVKDVAHFGNMTRQKMAEAAVFTRKLGLEIEHLGGILDKYDNFETAAEGVAQFARSFGVNLDVFALTQAEDGASRLDMMRKAFFEAGQDASKFSRVQLKMLAEASGLADASAAKLAFSQANVGESLGEIEKGADKATKKQLTQEEAMKKLADSIERLVRSGESFPGGFFAHFFKGFEIGLKRTRDFWGLMRNIRMSLRTTLMEGMKLGRELPQIFPAVKDLFGGLREAFEPKRFRQAFGGMRVAIVGFFKDLDVGKAPEEAVRTMLDKFTSSFTEFFGGQAGPMKRVADAMFRIGMTVARAFAAVVPVVMKKLAESITALAKFLTDPKAFFDAMKRAGDVTKGPKQAFIAALGEAWKAIAGAWPALRDSIVELFTVVKKKLEPWFKAHGPTIIKGALIFMFGPAVLGGILKGVAVSVITLLTKHLGGALLGGTSGVVKRVGPKLGMSLGGLMKFLVPAALFAGAAMGINKGLTKYGDDLKKSFLVKFGPGSEVSAKAGAAGAGIFESLTLGLLPDNAYEFVGEKLGELTQAVLEATKEHFGPGFGETLKNFVGGSIEIGGAIGGMLGAALKGDSDAFSKEFSKFTSELPMWIIRGIGLSLASSGYLSSWAANTVATITIGISKAFRQLLSKGDAIPGLKLLTKPIIENIELMEKTLNTFVKGMRGFAGFLFGGKSMEQANKDSGLTDASVELKRYLKAKFFPELDTVTEKFAQVWKNVQGIWGSAWAWFSTVVINPIRNRFEMLRDQVAQVFHEIWDKLVGSFEAGKAKVGKAFKMIAQALFEPFLKIVEKLDGVMNLGMKNTIASIRNSWQVSSPSRVMVKLGQNVVAGFEQGIQTMPDALTKHADVMVERVSDVGVASNQLRARLEANRAKAIELRAEMQKIQSGLGSDGTLTVKRPDHTIVINFKAVMEAGRLERTLIDRPGTEIVTAARPYG